MSGDLWESRAEKLRGRLADQLVSDGAVTDDLWRVAFETVPRHVFVPVFYRQTPSAQPAVDETSPAEWLEGVYSNQLLVVSSDVKSSSTIPSLMATMLEALAPADGHRVLEIGTGTGYNAALLCHRLGDSNVVSIDIAADLVNAARERLVSLGYHPTLGIGDGVDGWVGGALYDRIIATCAPSRIPQAWIEQTRAGGRIVSPLATGIAVIDFDDKRHGTGHFLPTGAFFMPLRPAPRPADLGSQIADITSAVATARSVELDESVWFDDNFRFIQALELPGMRFLTRLPETGVTIFTHPDGSWARIENGAVAQAGPQRIWDTVEHAHQQWDGLGRPGRDMFRLDIESDRQQVRLDGTGMTWQLPDVP